jgi:phosphate transport system permease protein
MNRRLEEEIFKGLMIASTVLISAVLVFVLGVVVLKGLPALNLAMLTQVPKGGYYLGGEGGILNAITGSLCLAGGATLLAFFFSLPIALFLRIYSRKSFFTEFTRLSLDVLWGVPSIVYGTFGFIIMVLLGLRASLLGGIVALVLLEFPIMTRAMDEVISMVPFELKESSYALGATRLEVATKVVARQCVPGILTAVLLAFGRGIGDAASILFTTGYTDSLPSSLFRPVASLPLAVFFQLATPIPEVQERAYASALVLTVIVLVVSLISRRIAGRFMAHIVR